MRRSKGKPRPTILARLKHFPLAHPFWIIESTESHRLRRDDRNGARRKPITYWLYQVKDDRVIVVNSASYKPGDLHDGDVTVSKARVVLDMLREAKARKGTVVCSHHLGNASELASGLDSMGLRFVMEIHPETRMKFANNGKDGGSSTPKALLTKRKLNAINIHPPNSAASYKAASLGDVDFAELQDLQCFAVARGGILDYPLGFHIGLASLHKSTSLVKLAHLLEWIRWIRPIVRRTGRATDSTDRSEGIGELTRVHLGLPARSNIILSRKHDEEAAEKRASNSSGKPVLKHRLAADKSSVNVIELFAGAGGMGLGFLLTSPKNCTRYRIISSAEIDPVYCNTLVTNHKFMRENRLVAADAVPRGVEAVDLCTRAARDHISALAKEHGGVDILIGGPPCQGFSSANRNNGSGAHPNNRLVETFLDYVRALQPRILLMENVQGILWTPRSSNGSQQSVAAHVAKRLESAGYQIYPKLLDAVWYGVPQHRSRFFLLGIHRDLGYRKDDFGLWGPFPEPSHGPGTDNAFVTVREAIRDLPRVTNGARKAVLTYNEPTKDVTTSAFLRLIRRGAPNGIVWDHVVSRQADYVIDRYEKISPGGNWEDVAHMMTNYAAVERTHSNIYRRLCWNEPSITIGHYRKSMIIHPSQNRGLSLREAARIQSFPDWFRFLGSGASNRGGIGHQQQQLANAVCPLVTKAVAEFMLEI